MISHPDQGRKYFVPSTLSLWLACCYDTGGALQETAVTLPIGGTILTLKPFSFCKDRYYYGGVNFDNRKPMNCHIYLHCDVKVARTS